VNRVRASSLGYAGLAACLALSSCLVNEPPCDECVFSGFTVSVHFDSAVPESTYDLRLRWDGIVRPCSLAIGISHLDCGPRAHVFRDASHFVVTSTETPESLWIEMTRAGADSLLWLDSIALHYVFQEETRCCDEASVANVRIER
jgi:hypothetical protein